MDSYDIVDKRNSSSNGTGFTTVSEEDLKLDVENITANEIHDNDKTKSLIVNRKDVPVEAEQEILLDDMEAETADDSTLRKRKPRTEIS